MPIDLADELDPRIPWAVSHPRSVLTAPFRIVRMLAFPLKIAGKSTRPMKLLPREDRGTAKQKRDIAAALSDESLRPQKN